MSASGIRIYGETGRGSIAQVTAGLAAACEHHGLLAGLVDCRSQNPEKRQAGEAASVAICCGDPFYLRLAHTSGRHARRWLMLAPNSEGFPAPFIQTLLGASPLGRGRLLDGLLGPSRWACSVLERCFEERPVVYAPHGVGAAFKANAASREQVSKAYEEGNFYVMHVTSSGTSRKGTRELLQAWQRLVESGGWGGAKLVVLSHPLHMEYHARMAGALGLSGQQGVSVAPGFGLPEAGIAEAYSHAHLICQPSRAEGFGLCLAKGSLVRTEAGAAPIENVAVGTRVQGRDGRYHAVAARAQRKVKYVLEIDAHGVPPLRVTTQHPVLSVMRDCGIDRFRKSEHEPRWREARDLGPRHYLVVPKPSCRNLGYRLSLLDYANDPIEVEGGRFYERYSGSRNSRAKATDIAAAGGWSIRSVRAALEPMGAKRRMATAKRGAIRVAARKMGYFDQKLSLPRALDVDNSFCRLLGYYATEGSTQSRGAAVGWAFDSRERDAVARRHVHKALEKLGLPASERTKVKSRGMEIICCSSVLARCMDGLCGHGAANKHLPAWVFDLAREQRRALLEALMRGDGSHEGSGAKSLRFASVSAGLAFQVRDLWLSLGIPASVRPKRIPSRKRGSLSVIRRRGRIVKTRRLIWSVSVGGRYYEAGCRAVRWKPHKRAQRKGTHWVEQKGCWLVRVKRAMKRRTTLPVYDLQVPSNESFVVQGVVVHNCPLEARACGVPVAATACTGHLDHIGLSAPAGVIVIPHGGDEESDDFLGARAPSVCTADIEEALIQARGRWRNLSKAALYAADELRQRHAWEGSMLGDALRHILAEAEQAA